MNHPKTRYDVTGIAPLFCGPVHQPFGHQRLVMGPEERHQSLEIHELVRVQ